MLTREEKKNFLLNQLPPNTDCYYVDGFINGFDCTYDAVLKDFEATIKAKDEEIERLNCRAYHAEGYISDLHNYQNDKKFYDAKARSIVAMLFWEARKTLTEYRNAEHCDALYNSYYGQKQQFIEAYAMLKDNS